MRVLFAGGGTAGHINPALAAAGYLREKEPDAHILYVGNKGGMEERLVPAAGFKFRTIRISGFQRKLSLKNIKRNAQTVVRVFSASAEAKKIIKEFQPDICVGTGGYVSGPVIRAAQKLGIPTVIHEQNAYPGVTTKMLAKHADCVMLAVEDAKKYLERTDNCVFTGNPVRTSVLKAERAASRKALVGNYEGTASRYVTVLEGIQDYVGDRARVFYSEGCPLHRDKTSGLTAAGDRLSEVKAVCEASDVVVAVMGLDADIEGEQGDAGNEFASGDKPDLNFPGLQPEVLRIAAESGKPVILVSLTGSAMAFAWEDAHIPAILQAWYPGAQGGHAVARVLFGESCPEGKLPVTFYRTMEELPEFTDYSMKGRTYRYMQQDALYPFGYGLSYTRFELGEAKALQENIEAGGCVQLDVSIQNTGAMAGGQTVQVYVKALREGTPNPQLKGLKKVFLKPGEETRVTIFLLDTAFALYDEEGRRMLEAGEYAVFVGMQQPDGRSEALTGQKPRRIRIVCGQTAQL